MWSIIVCIVWRWQRYPMAINILLFFWQNLADTFIFYDSIWCRIVIFGRWVLSEFWQHFWGICKGQLISEWKYEVVALPKIWKKKFENSALNNVCFIKIPSKHSNNTLLSLLRIFMKQTLWLICTCASSKALQKLSPSQKTTVDF